MKNNNLSGMLMTAFDKKDCKMKTQDLMVRILRVIENDDAPELDLDTAELIEEEEWEFDFSTDTDAIEIETMLLNRMGEFYLDAVVDAEDNRALLQVFHRIENVFNPNTHDAKELTISSLLVRFGNGINYVYTIRIVHVGICPCCQAKAAKKKGKK